MEVKWICIFLMFTFFAVFLNVSFKTYCTTKEHITIEEAIIAAEKTNDTETIGILRNMLKSE